MANSLAARLLAEIERREELARIARTVNAKFHHPGDLIDQRGYLWALRKVVEIHRNEAFADDPGRGFCVVDQRTAGVWPCLTITAIAEAFGVTP